MNRRLYRSRTDSVIGGVAGGLAEYLGADPALVRVAWALVVVITGGAALLAYVVAWIIVPEAPLGATGDAISTDGTPPGDADPVTGQRADETTSAARPAAAPPARPMNGGLLVGGGLVLLGIWFLAREYLPAIDWSLVWPVLLIGVGALILLSSGRNRAR
jgi:phage shock protein C